MDFRLLAVAFVFFLPSVFASPMSEMDKLVPLVYQYPSQASKIIDTFDTSKFTFREKLRLELIKCDLHNQNGDGQAAINRAQLAIAEAKTNQLEEALPYFYICMADGYSYIGEYEHTFSLLDSAISLARQHNQPQALVNGLRNRAQFDTETEDFSSAIEDLRLAIDIAPQQFTQKHNWFWAPQAYIYLPMAHLFFAMNDFERSAEYLELLINTEDLKGKVQHHSFISAAKIYFYIGNNALSKEYIAKAKETSFELDSPLENATSRAVIASLEYEMKNYEQAEKLILWSIKIFGERFKVIDQMRTKRTLAKIRFAQNRDAEALELMKEVVEQANMLNQYIDLQEFYHILENYYLKQGDSEKAYQNLKLAYEAGNKANKELNSARFIQYKARLDRQASIHSQQRQSPKPPVVESSGKHKIYKLVVFVFVMLGICIFFVVFQSKRQAKKQRELAKQVLPINDELNQVLLNSKKQASPLATLLVDVSKLDAQKLKELQQGIDDVIRETDIVSRFSASELLILLPNTSNAGAQKVVAHLHRHLKKVTVEDHIFGMASMQQFDQIEQLIKRANFDRLTQIKNREIRTTRFEDFQAL